MTGRRVAALLPFLLGAGLALPAIAAALLTWTLTVTPLNATAGQTTTFTLTATNLDVLGDLGCLEVQLPDSFQSVSAAIVSTPSGATWSASVTGTTVAVFSLTGGGRLGRAANESVTFTITASPTVAGPSTWANYAHVQQSCSGPDELSLEPLVVIVLPAPAPTPTPTAPPGPSPTPTPTAILPLPSLPLALPSAGVLPTPAPIRAWSPTPGPTSTPVASAASRGPSVTPLPSAASPPSTTADPGAGPSLGAGRGATDSGSFALRFDEGRLDLGAGTIGLLAGVEIWAIPAATIAVPGFLVLLWVALQAAGAVAWIPAARRLRGDRAPRARRR